MTNYSHTFKSGAKVNTVYRAAKFFFHHVPKYIPPLISRKNIKLPHTILVPIFRKLDSNLMLIYDDKY